MQFTGGERTSRLKAYLEIDTRPLNSAERDTRRLCGRAIG
jgi:hypothetical protein